MASAVTGFLFWHNIPLHFKSMWLESSVAHEDYHLVIHSLNAHLLSIHSAKLWNRSGGDANG